MLKNIWKIWFKGRQHLKTTILLWLPQRSRLRILFLGKLMTDCCKIQGYTGVWVQKVSTLLTYKLKVDDHFMLLSLLRQIKLAKMSHGIFYFSEHCCILFGWVQQITKWKSFWKSNGEHFWLPLGVYSMMFNCKVSLKSVFRLLEECKQETSEAFMEQYMVDLGPYWYRKICLGMNSSREMVQKLNS